MYCKVFLNVHRSAASNGAVLDLLAEELSNNNNVIKGELDTVRSQLRNLQKQR